MRELKMNTLINDTAKTVKTKIMQEGLTLTEVVYACADKYGWSDSLSCLSGKLERDTLRYHETVEIADILGYDVIWQKRGS